MRKRILLFAIIAIIIDLSFAQTPGDAAIRNTGNIVTGIYAKSGYWRDIQDAVNLAASSGAGIVHIPEGTWNFVNDGENGMVTIPAGVSVFGAPTIRTSGLPYDGYGQNPNGQVIEWKTVLRVPWDVPHKGFTFFTISGSSNPTKPSRFSDIKLVGYRTIDPNSTSWIVGLNINNVIGYRVDHCFFEHVTWDAVSVYGTYCCGVIDHCVFHNEYGHPGDPVEDPNVNNVCQGVGVERTYSAIPWGNDEDILGHYNNWTTFIEDCYFDKWRSAIAGNAGAHYVCRHNTFENTFAKGEVDAHPSWASPTLSNRAAEIYNCVFGEVYQQVQFESSAIDMRGGSGVIFNNRILDPLYYGAVYMWNGGGWSSQFNPYFFIWDNEYVTSLYVYGSAVLGTNYFFSQPTWAYTPYVYPHPLTLS